MNAPFPSRSGTELAVPGVAANLPAPEHIWLDAQGFVAIEPAGTSAPPAPARRRRSDIGLFLAASVLSAVLASGATAALGASSRTSSADAALTTAATTSLARATTSTGAAASIAAIAAAANPAVVTIDTRITARGDPRGAGTGVGSGFVYDANGSILTAAHVVEGATEITVTLADGRTFQGTVTASDLALDVAVVRIAASGLPTIPLETSDAANVGEAVIAIGDPLGDYPGSVTIGIVSGLDRSVTVADEMTGRPRDLAGMIQTDAAINPGNSGGPLIDTAGKVIGVISASSSSAQGMGFAVPISAANGVMASSKTA